jgi:hypothetical protein
MTEDSNHTALLWLQCISALPSFRHQLPSFRYAQHMLRDVLGGRRQQSHNVPKPPRTRTGGYLYGGHELELYLQNNAYCTLCCTR